MLRANNLRNKLTQPWQQAVRYAPLSRVRPLELANDLQRALRRGSAHTASAYVHDDEDDNDHHHLLQQQQTILNDKKVHNFSPGPGALPDAVVQRAAREFTSLPDAPGQPVFSISHRENNSPYQRLHMRVTNQVREVLSVPDNYHVLFMQGGAHAQFAALPLNLCAAGTDAPRRIASVDTGFWSRRAAKEMRKYSEVEWAAVADSTSTAPPTADAEPPALYDKLPDVASWRLSPDTSLVHVCANETIHGLEMLSDPDISRCAGAHTSPPLAADFTSTLLSRPVDVSKYGVIYCSGGKNLGPSGLTLVIVRDDLVTRELESPYCPKVLSYADAAESAPIHSMHYTPPTFAVYMAGLVLEHIQEQGGLEAAEQRSLNRSRHLYELIDESDGFYVNKVADESRSRMSVPFRIGGDRDPDDAARLEAAFIAEAEVAGFRHVAGHPLFGGMRASLYHGVPNESIAALATFMDRFHAKNR